MMFTQQLSWRRAVKKFTQQPLSEVQLKTILEAVRMAPTSLGLQPFYVRLINDRALLAELAAAGHQQAQFGSCSHLLVFVARADVGKRIDEVLQARSGGDAKKLASLAGFAEMARGSVGVLSEAEAKAWAQKQIYIALGFAMAAAAELNVDSCPMEGFEPEKFDKILKLPKAHYSTVLLTVGFRDPEKGVPYPQQRMAIEDLIKK